MATVKYSLIRPFFQAKSLPGVVGVCLWRLCPVKVGIWGIRSGIFTLFGTAAAGEFDYYKFEIRPDFAEIFNFYDRFEAPVVRDALGQLNTAQFGPGLYWLRLVVVDRTGNFATPCIIPLIFE